MTARIAVSENMKHIAWWTSLILTLSIISLLNYPLFHAIAELFSIVVAYGIFMIAWNSRLFRKDGYLLFLGVAYAFVGTFDLMHTITFDGIGAYKPDGKNLTVQLWIVSRYLESVSLLIAPLFLKKTIRPNRVISYYLFIVLMIITSMFLLDIFPVAFIENGGITPFKKYSEYIICMILAASIYHHVLNRNSFDDYVLRYLIYSISLTILSELSFTLYINIFGFFNFIGHMLKLASFYLIYKAVIYTGFQNPYNLMFRDLKIRELELKKAHDDLEIRVQRRTSELAAMNEELLNALYSVEEAEKKTQHLNQVLRAIRNINQLIVRGKDLNTFLQGVCDALIESRVYLRAWLALFSPSGEQTIFRGAGTGGGFDELEKKVKQGYIPYCLQKSSSEPGVAIIRNRKEKCGDCPISDRAEGPISMSIRLEHNDRTFGYLTVDAPHSLSIEKEELSLFEEVAGDIAYAVNSLEMEQERLKAKAALEKQKNELDQRVTQLNCLYNMSRIGERYSDSQPDLFRSVLQLIPASMRYPDLISARITFKDRSYMTTPYIETSRKFLADIIVNEDEYGKLEVYYDTNGESEIEATFSDEEKQLLREISERLIMILENLDAENELIEKQIAQAGAEHASKMKDEFLSFVGHELRTPLSGILGFAQTIQRLKDRGKLSEKKLESLLNNILDSGRHLATLVDDMLDIARIEAGKLKIEKEPVRLQEVADHVFLNLAGQAEEKGIGFEVQIPEKLPTVQADRLRLNQVFLNLVGNAVKFTEEGKVAVEAKMNDSSEMVSISIKDTGPGIPEEYLPKIFNRFVRIESSGKIPGTGLGLAITKELVEKMGGRITASSEIKKGSEFIITLPVWKKTGDEGLNRQ